MRKVSTNFFRNRIENHLDEVDLDVVCRKRKSGYALYWDDGDEPIAKLRPTGSGDEVQVYSWEDGRWQAVVELENRVPLDEALEYITDDPDDLFFSDSGDDNGEPALRTLIPPGVASNLLALFLTCSAIGGAVGGVFSSPVAGAAWGGLAGLLCPGGLELFRGRIKRFLSRTVTIGIPAMFPAAIGGILGASLHGAVGTGIGWLLCSVLAGFLCGLFLLSHRYGAWSGGFAAGVALGMQLVEAFALSSDTARFVLVAIVASISANFCSLMWKWLDNNIRLASMLQDSE